MRILVTAGPTREPIDPVRFISNRSSGKMGYAVAAEAAKRGHTVRLVSGPVSLAVPAGVERALVVTAEEMLEAVVERLGWCEALIMAAAVADWRPREVSPRKIRKDQMRMSLELERTPDILSRVKDGKGSRLHVGFAAETHEVLESAQRKLASKGLDLIVANDVSQPDAGFEVDTNRVCLIGADGTREELPVMAKSAVAGRILDWIERRSGRR
jgi:phosphopantothenoylcysteine decarboxylase/phosphopantothenate--cysteine ligase